MLHRIVHTSFFLSLATSIFGAALKIMHRPGSEPLLIVALFTTLVFIITALMEIRRSPKIDHREKTMWTIAFLFMSGFTGIVYMTMGRRKVI
jgi:bacteriorhodopsin